MGKAARERPARLAEKLVAIRKALNLSQNEMVRRLGLDGRLIREDISRFERGVGGEPPLDVLLRYARAISTTGRGEFLEAIIDDELDLPSKLPSEPRILVAKRKKRTTIKSKP
jgi:transcriptional regulator with XRE-family HTH domain